MPIYEFQCENCGHRLEALQKISDPPLTDCPSCKQPALRKLVSAGGFILKGSGWYVTDFRDKGKSASDSSKTSVAKPDSGGSTTSGSGGGSDSGGAAKTGTDTK